MADISRQLEQLVSISDQRIKIEQYRTALGEYLGVAGVGSLKAFVEHVAGETVPLSVSRVVLLVRDQFGGAAARHVGAGDPASRPAAGRSPAGRGVVRSGRARLDPSQQWHPAGAARGPCPVCGRARRPLGARAPRPDQAGRLPARRSQRAA